MSLLDQILGFFKDLISSNTQQSDERRTLQDKDVPFIHRFLAELAASAVRTTVPGVGGAIAPVFERLALAAVQGEDTVQSLQNNISAWIAKELDPVLNLVLVERQGLGRAPGGGTVEDELSIFAVGVNEAIAGAFTATSLVVALNAAAGAADAATQILSAGQIQGFQQLVQNIIWATGLADLGGLSFRPQIAASFQPLLERHYHSKAQAEIPGPGDLVRFQLREVFEPERRRVLLGDDDITPFKAFMNQRGFPDYWADSFWAAHWILPATTQLNEMVHRGTISTEEWRRQVRFNDFVPEAIPWLEDIIYSPFTRVDARRMADIGLLNDLDLIQSYADIGYFAPKEQDATGRHRAQFVPQDQFEPTVHKAQSLVIFTRVFNVIPDIRRRLANGFIQPTNVESEILALGVPAAEARNITETLVKAADLGSGEAIRDLTTAQIVRGTKLGLISFNQGLLLLNTLGWDVLRAELLVRASGVLVFMPSLEEFLRLYDLCQVAKQCRGEECHKPDEACFKQAALIDTQKIENAPQCDSEGHDGLTCFDCQKVVTLLAGLAAKLQAAGIVFPPGVLE